MWRGNSLKKIILSLIPVMVVIALLTGCGNVKPSGASNPPIPPNLTVKIANQKIKAITNGYKWSRGNTSSVADAPSPIASNLKKYNAKIGERVTLSFDKKPQNIEMTLWSNGKQISKSKLKQNGFNLPSKSGDYKYEITGHWGNDYVNYDFEVQVY
jgi:hypothetical protein